MSINIVNEYVNSYSATVQLLLQQQGSKLRAWMMSGSYVGKGARIVDQIGQIVANQVTGVFQPMGRTDALITNRWVYPSDFDVNQMIDQFEKLRLIADPESQYPINASYALGRAMDAVIIAAFFGTAQTGVDGTTAVTFGTAVTTSAGNNIAVATGAASATGLNAQKIKVAKQRSMANFVDIDNDALHCAITSIQFTNLMSDVQLIDGDFSGQDRPILVDGKLKSWYGVNFHHVEVLTTGTDDGSNTSRQIPFWAHSGMHLGIWNDITHRASQRNDIQGEPWQLYSKMTIGATRVEENKVLRIWAYES